MTLASFVTYMSIANGVCFYAPLPIPFGGCMAIAFLAGIAGVNIL